MVTRTIAAQGLNRLFDVGVERTGRMDWLLGLIDAASGDSSSGIAKMLQAIRASETIDMLGDAGFVRLDLVAEYLKTENSELVERFAREAAETFAKNGARLHLMEALDYLRQAVQRREATPTTSRT